MSAPLTMRPYKRRERPQAISGLLLPLTGRQQQVVDFMWGFYRENDMLPGMNDICRHFSWASSNAALTHVREIEKRGYIELNAVEKYRFTAMFHAEQQQAKDGEQ